jgi:hypothetical protein
MHILTYMLDTIYDFNSLNSLVEARLRSRHINYRAASLACEIHPSYFSRAMKAQVSLSQNQLFRILSFLNLSEKQKDYAFLLWQYEGAQGRDEKNFFSQKIKQIQEENQKITRRIKANIFNSEERKIQLDTYYREAVTALVHMYLTIPSFRNDPESICAPLGIPYRKLTDEIEKLEKLSLVTRRDPKQCPPGQVKIHLSHVEESIHLPEESLLAAANHVNWRLKTIQSIQARDPKPNDLHLSVVFSADDEVKTKLKKLLREAIVNAQALVGTCDKPTEVYQLMIDLY